MTEPKRLEESPEPSLRQRLTSIEGILEDVENFAAAVKSGGLKESLYMYVALLVSLYGILAAANAMYLLIPIALGLITIVFSGYIKKLYESKGLVEARKLRKELGAVKTKLEVSQQEVMALRAEKIAWAQTKTIN